MKKSYKNILSSSSNEEVIIKFDFKKKINFEKVYTDEEIQKNFILFLKKENNLDPFIFTLQVEKIKKLKTEKDKIYFIADLINNYIETDSPNEINLSGEMKKKLLVAYEKQKKESEIWVLNVKPDELLLEYSKSIKFDLESKFILKKKMTIFRDF
jgi:isopentenyl phosphate kinase